MNWNKLNLFLVLYNLPLYLVIIKPTVLYTPGPLFIKLSTCNLKLKWVLCAKSKVPTNLNLNKFEKTFFMKMCPWYYYFCTVINITNLILFFQLVTVPVHVRETTIKHSQDFGHNPNTEPHTIISIIVSRP